MNGISIFREYFHHFKNQYTIIGGVACSLLMEEAGFPFRQTVDIDMVLIVEALTPEFAKAFWDFIQVGEYQIKRRSNGQPQFYRSSHPKNPAFPKMIELFSRSQNPIILHPDSHLTPLHVDEEISSLSAILLNDDYYRFLLNGRTVSDDVSILDAEHIIPFKMKAWLDLKNKKREGMHVDSHDIKKHCLDVFRLSQLVSASSKILVSASIQSDIDAFIDQMSEEEIHLMDLGIRESKEEILNILQQIYILE